MICNIGLVVVWWYKRAAASIFDVNSEVSSILDVEQATRGHISCLRKSEPDIWSTLYSSPFHTVPTAHLIVHHTFCARRSAIEGFVSGPRRLRKAAGATNNRLKTQFGRLCLTNSHLHKLNTTNSQSEHHEHSS